jgi:hypothetical protein
MMRAIGAAAFVFSFMVFLAAQAATGFMHGVFAGQVYPRAMRPLDCLIETFFTGPLGHKGGALAILVLGGVLAGLAFRRAMRDGDFDAQ